MPKSAKSITTQLSDLLVSKGFDPIPLDSDAQEVEVAEDADVLQFQFTESGKDLGTVTITVDGAHEIVVYYNDSVTQGDLPSSDPNSWVGFLSALKKFAQRRQMSFRLNDMNRLGYDMKKRSHHKRVNEGYYGTRNISYSDNTPPTIKMIIKHSRPLDENDQRYRNIDRIFLENQMGERILVPSKKPSIGRVFARHLAEGGEYRDDRWRHIAELSEDISKLGGFVRATKSKQFNESVQRLVTEASGHYQHLRETIKRLQSSRGYNTYFENWQPMIMEAGDTDSLSSLFRVDTLDPRIEQAMPVLGKLNLKITEMSESAMFEQWADGIVMEKLQPTTPRQISDLVELLGPDSDDLSVGADGMNAINSLHGLIDDQELNDRILQAADIDSNRDARPIIIAWMSEQPGTEYDEILDVIQAGEEENTVAEPEPQSKPQDKKPETEKSQDIPPPPVKENTVLAQLRRLSGI
jgi:hypothetical protein